MRHGAVGEVTVTVVRWGTCDHRWPILHTQHTHTHTSDEQTNRTTTDLLNYKSHHVHSFSQKRTELTDPGFPRSYSPFLLPKGV